MRGDRGESFGGVLVLLASLVATSLVAGVIAAGLFMPVIGATGAAARGGVSFFDSLPDELQASPLAQQSRILAADGSVIATFYSENRIVVPLSKIAPIMQKAQVAIEDSRFYEHGGIDPKGVVRALVKNVSSGDSSQGASTLTQQYVKLTLQENALYAGDEAGAKAAVHKDFSRKVQEMKYAVALEQKLSKPQILEGYLNIAYYGDGAYGVEAAARHYFSTTAEKLSLPQAATLAGIVQLPGYYDPRNNPKAALGRRNIVLDRMLETGAITKAEHDKAVATKLVLKVSKTGNGCDSSRYQFFCEYVYRTVLNNPIFGANQSDRSNLVKRGGLTIQTTLDPKMQAVAQKAVHDRVPAKNKTDVASALSVVEPGTGKVLAMAQSKPYGRNAKKGETSVNLNVDRLYGGGNGFQTGSTFKAVTLAAALNDGRSLHSVVNAPPGGTTFRRNDFKAGSCTDLRQNYAPYNAEGHERGPMTLIAATANSVNTAFVQLEADIGICDVATMAGQMGIHLASPLKAGQPNGVASTKLRPYGSLTLGSETVAPLTMAAAYATFAADGEYCAPMPITSVTTRDGKLKQTIKPDCHQAMTDAVARGVTVALQAVITSGTGRGASIGRPAAGKTGTTNLSTDVWFAGYTPQLAAAVWVGHQDEVRPLKNFTLGSRSYGTVFGATIPAPIWGAFMRGALKGQPVEQFGSTTPKVLYGDRIAVPQVNGLSMDAAKSALTAAGFQVSISTTGIPSDQPVGTVADSSPHQGQRATPGATVTLFPSLGPVASPPTGGPGGNQGGGGGQPGGQPTNPGQGGGGGHGGGGGGG